MCVCVCVCSAGVLSSDVALSLSRYLANERNSLPWVTALSWFTVLGRRLSLTPLYGQYAVSGCG